jgi:hypothetical protein
LCLVEGNRKRPIWSSKNISSLSSQVRRTGPTNTSASHFDFEVMLTVCSNIIGLHIPSEMVQSEREGYRLVKS